MYWAERADSMGSESIDPSKPGFGRQKQGVAEKGHPGLVSASYAGNAVSGYSQNQALAVHDLGGTSVCRTRTAEKLRLSAVP